MKKYMLLFISEDYQQLGLSPDQMQARMSKWFAWDQKMNAQGIVETGHALVPTGTSISGSQRSVKDGLYSESKEVIGGYYVVKVADMKAAQEVAQDYPDYDLGGAVEIREVVVFEN